MISIMNFKKILLSKNDCDTKNNIIYSSWSVTWEKLLETFPDAQVDVLERIFEDGNRLPYFGNDKIGYMVMVKITIPSKNNWTFTERLAIVDIRNNSILKEEQIDSRDICDTIQRCINKVIARVNIGLNVYQKDFSDIPEKKIEKGITQLQEKELLNLLNSCKGITIDAILNAYKVSTLTDIPVSLFDKIKNRILLKIEEEKNNVN